MTARTRALFVYGSLRRGQNNHGLLDGATPLGVARTAPGYRLLDLGAWPGMVLGGDERVVGERYAVDQGQLARLDAFERHPVLFRRQPIELEGGERAEAYLCVAPGSGPWIAGGDWVKRSGV